MKAFSKRKKIVEMNRKFLLSLGLSLLLLFGTAASLFDTEPRQRWWRRTPPVERMEFIATQVNAAGIPLEVVFERGRAHNHPLMAIWVEDLEGNYIQTLYVAESIGKGVFLHGDPSTGRWQPGPIRRPAALPYWGHQRGIQYEDGLFIPTQNNPMPDAITGPTPKGNFTLQTQTPEANLRQFRVLIEINQSWDWNQYWHNNKFPGDPDYQTSSQPAVVYETIIDLDSENQVFELKPIGYSHWSGKTGELFTDLSTLTTALNIIKQAKVKLSVKE